MDKSQNTLTWGAAPTTTCMKLWEFVEPEDYKDVLVWGVGDGRNVIFLAGQGYNVTAIDPSAEAIEKLEAWAKESGLKINTRVESVDSSNLGGPYDIVISVGLINLIPSCDREKTFQKIQSITNTNGLNAISAFVDKPFLNTKNDAHMKSGNFSDHIIHGESIEKLTQSLSNLAKRDFLC
ncbi:MAG: class I SAM-dependent methyltransferase [Caldisericia bacterium]